MKKKYPCDIPNSLGEFQCPYGAEFTTSSYFCQEQCGLGVDIDSYPEENTSTPSNKDLFDSIKHHNEMIDFIEQFVPADILDNFFEHLKAYRTAILVMKNLLEERGK